MDIQYLLWLQDLRNSLNDAWTPFMEWASMFAITYLILIPVFVYWVLDKKKGLYVLVSYYFCMFLNPIMKLTACVYRPWIRDSQIVPAGDAIATATGYSFPSGHTSTVGPLSGGMAVICWKEKKTRWLSFIFAGYVLLTGFSRNYLGVHTPQDVFVGIVISVLSLILTYKFLQYLEEHPERENLFLLIAFAICALGILYITLKPYPMDLKADGSLLVDPNKMMNDGYGDIGKTMGFILARYVEKNWIRFRNPGLNWLSILVSIAGLLLMTQLKAYLRPSLVAALGDHWGRLVFSVLYTFYYIALFPIVFKFLGKKKES